MPLKGIRVIDFSQYIPGSFTSLRLARLGAEVIKVEPLTGDPVRYFGKEMEATGVVFAANNRNKKSIALNLKEEKGAEIAKELLKKADVVIESYRPYVMEGFGLDYHHVKDLKEDIIYLSLSGYGKEGSSFGSHDLNYQSISGILSKLTDEKGKPIMPKLTFADIVGGMSAIERILAALYRRERAGKGEFIDLSLMDSMLSMMNLNIYTASRTGKENVIPQLDGELISYHIYQTKDNRYVSLAALEPKFWRNFCEAINKEEWILAHLTTDREDNEVYQELKKVFLQRTLEEWTSFSLEVDCCLSPILKVNEIESHPYVQLKDIDNHDDHVPALGEHTTEILKSLLEKDDYVIEELRKHNIIL